MATALATKLCRLSVADFAWIIVGLFIAVSPALADNKLAFVVGIDTYPQLGPQSQLSRAVADAEAVGDTLGLLGFQVTRVTRDTGLDAIIEKFEAFKQAVQPGDTVFFYYAGHGVSLDDGNYLIPSDIPALGPGDEGLVRHHALAEREIKQELRASGARVAVVVLDACRDNPFPPRGTRSLGAATRGLARIEAQQGVFSLYSAREGQTALDRLSDADRDQNSVFTRVFLRALKTPGLNLSELGDVVRDEVAALARTNGHDQVPAVSNDLLGVFLAGPAPVPPSPVVGPIVSRPAMLPAPAAGPKPAPAVVAALPAEPAPDAARRPLTPAEPGSATPLVRPSFEQAEAMTATLDAALALSADDTGRRVAVSPYGDAYHATLDVKRIIEGLVPGSIVAPATQSVSLKPQEAGAWAVAGSALPRLALRAGTLSLQASAEAGTLQAAFDPALPGFPTGRIVTDATLLDIMAPPVLRRQRIGHAELVEQAAPAGDGATSLDIRYTMTDLANSTLDAPPAPGMTADSSDRPPVDIGAGLSVTARSGALETHIDGLRLKALIDLRAFLLAHPRPDADAAMFERLRGLLRDALPVLTSLRQGLSFKGMDVVLPMQGGSLAADDIGLELDIAGLSTAGHAALTLTWDGFSVTGPKVPPWMADLWPRSGLVKPTFWGFHLVEAGRRLLDDYDFSTKDWPPGDAARIAHVAAPMGGLQVLIEPSRITSRLVEIDVEGEIDALPDPTGTLTRASGAGDPTAHFTVIAKGIDRAIAALQAAAGSQEGAADMLAKLGAIKALGRPQPDGTMVWQVDVQSKTVAVNGTIVK
jgi:hypothetical protein